MIGPDGHGWYGHDKNGNRIYKSDAQLEAEGKQSEADKARREQLYVSDEYKVFFLTRQPGPAGADDDRKAYISVKPFSEIPAEAFDEMKARAEPWNTAASQVRIEAKEPLLVFHDDITSTQSTIYIGELDPDVRRKLRGGNGAENAWGSLFNKAAAANPAAVVTVKDDIAVHRPISFKHAL
jgi:hypothetical protein